MKVFVTASFKEGKNKKEIEQLCDLVKQSGFQAFCFIREVEKYKKVFDDPKEMLSRALEELKKCQYLLIDFSKKSTGRSYETGMAYALGIKVIGTLQTGTIVNTSTRGLADILIEYKQIKDIVAPLKKYFENQTTKLPNNEISNLTIFCDGASRGNPGPSASAFVAINEKEEVIHKAGEFIGETTNNVAEYKAAILALEWLLKSNTLNKIKINLDSELLFKQIIGRYKVKAIHLKPMHHQITQLISRVQSRGVQVEFQHQLRDKNKLADELANQVLDEQTS